MSLGVFRSHLPAGRVRAPLVRELPNTSILRPFGLMLLALFLTGAPASAQTVDIPKSLVCSFNKEASSTFSGSWNDGVRDSAPLDLTFAAIDLQKQTAQVIGETGSPAVSAFLRNGNLHVLETTGGDVALTTVWLRTDRARLPAAYSRHSVGSGNVMLAQYRGFCDARF